MRVLITGANRGIGAALSQTLDARGNEVIGTARAAQGCVPLDVTQPNQITALARQLSDAPLDALICNSGVFHDKHERLDDGYPPEMWAQEFAVNVTGVFLMVQAFLPHLRKAPACAEYIRCELAKKTVVGMKHYKSLPSRAAEPPVADENDGQPKKKKQKRGRKCVC